MKYTIDKVLSHGFVMGSIKIDEISKHSDTKTSKEKEMNKFLSSIEKSVLELDNMNDDSYIMIQKLMIQDPLLKENGIKYINNGKTAREAINLVMSDIISSLEASSSDYLKERTNDILDVTKRLINNLGNKKKKTIDKPFILYTDNLLPSYVINNRDNLIGVIAKSGGYTSHSAILCRSFDIPYVIATIDCKNSDTACIDTRKNKIAINPDVDDMERYIEEINASKKFIKKAVNHKGFLFLANISLTSEIKKVLEYDFDGIGLYRTELIFMNSNRPLSFDEQYKIYSNVSLALGDRSVCFRTFDVGDDKKLKYLKTKSKGLNNYLENKDIFETQIKALLKSNIFGNVKIMFPMIETIEEFMELKNWTIRIAKENNYKIPPIGMMLETKKALENIKDFRSADFISLGTNDLCSELYHIDRMNRLNDFNEYLDDLLDKIKVVIDFCNKHNILLSVCGELASVKEVAVKFYKLGIRNLSVSPSMIQMLNSSYNEFISGN